MGARSGGGGGRDSTRSPTPLKQSCGSFFSSLITTFSSYGGTGFSPFVGVCGWGGGGVLFPFVSGIFLHFIGIFSIERTFFSLCRIFCRLYPSGIAIRKQGGG